MIYDSGSPMLWFRDDRALESCMHKSAKTQLKILIEIYIIPPILYYAVVVTVQRLVVRSESMASIGVWVVAT